MSDMTQMLADFQANQEQSVFIEEGLYMVASLMKDADPVENADGIQFLIKAAVFMEVRRKQMAALLELAIQYEEEAIARGETPGTNKE